MSETRRLFEEFGGEQSKLPVQIKREVLNIRTEFEEFEAKDRIFSGAQRLAADTLKAVESMKSGEKLPLDLQIEMHQTALEMLSEMVPPRRSIGESVFFGTTPCVVTGYEPDEQLYILSRKDASSEENSIAISRWNSEENWEGEARIGDRYFIPSMYALGHDGIDRVVEISEGSVTLEHELEGMSPHPSASLSGGRSAVERLSDGIGEPKKVSENALKTVRGMREGINLCVRQVLKEGMETQVRLRGLLAQKRAESK